MFSARINPRVNLNGSTRGALANASMDAHIALAAAAQAMRDCYPHGRDYQTAADPHNALAADRAIALARIAAAEALADAYLEDAMSIEGGALDG